KTAVIGGDGKAVRRGGDAGGVRDRLVPDDAAGLGVQHDEAPAVRRGEADEPLAPVDGDGADIVGKADRGFFRKVDEGEVLASAEMADERRQVVARPLVLAGEPDAAPVVEVDMARGELTQF